MKKLTLYPFPMKTVRFKVNGSLVSLRVPKVCDCIFTHSGFSIGDRIRYWEDRKGTIERFESDGYTVTAFLVSRNLIDFGIDVTELEHDIPKSKGKAKGKGKRRKS